MKDQHSHWKLRIHSCTHSLQEILWKFLIMLNIDIPYEPVLLPLDIFPERKGNLHPHTDQHTNVHSSIIYDKQRWRQTTQPSADERINRMWYIHTIKYYLSIKSGKWYNVVNDNWRLYHPCAGYQNSIRCDTTDWL